MLLNRISSIFREITSSVEVLAAFDVDTPLRFVSIVTIEFRPVIDILMYGEQTNELFQFMNAIWRRAF